jgi:hypothetical protein
MSLETSVNSNLPDSTSITISDLASINCVLGIMKSPEMEATDGVGVPAVAAARGTREGQGATPLHRALQEPCTIGGRGG